MSFAVKMVSGEVSESAIETFVQLVNTFQPMLFTGPDTHQHDMACVMKKMMTIERSQLQKEDVSSWHKNSDYSHGRISYWNKKSISSPYIMKKKLSCIVIFAREVSAF